MPGLHNSLNLQWINCKCVFSITDCLINILFALWVFPQEEMGFKMSFKRHVKTTQQTFSFDVMLRSTSGMTYTVVTWFYQQFKLWQKCMLIQNLISYSRKIFIHAKRQFNVWAFSTISQQPHDVSNEGYILNLWIHTLMAVVNWFGKCSACSVHHLIQMFSLTYSVYIRTFTWIYIEIKIKGINSSQLLCSLEDKTP